ncbi:unnamed protein product [Notodromas monacha]|uniref:Kelch-like protein diablo n=1 Tax=Notodromas monacha TaxID=399045 RepID=A0A7R9BLE9_9CRUS|nr:unnamed protein product [Notodromas monacha]CAG0916317.1 unnamed protein product [Notodromas monacha]
MYPVSSRELMEVICSLSMNDSGLNLNAGKWARRCRHVIQDDSDSTSSSVDCPEEESFPNEYKYIESLHPVQMLAGLNDLRKSGTFCDVKLNVDGDNFPAHKVILASFSPYFKAMFNTPMAEAEQDVVHLRGVEAQMIGLLIDFAYTSEIIITQANVQSLLSAANLLEFSSVRDACCQFMEKHIDAHNCIGIHCFAEAHACEPLQQKAKEFILKNFMTVYVNEEFLKLSQSKLIECLRDEDLIADKEETVFDAAERWLNHDMELRKDEFHLVLENVRLALLSPYFLHDRVEKSPIVQASPQCLAFVEEAKLFHLLPGRRPEIKSVRCKPRNNSTVTQVAVAVGGEDAKVVLRSVECFCPTRKVWKTLACLPYAISKHGLVVSGENVMYLAGGEFPDGSASRAVWRYDPVFDQWQEMAQMLEPRSELGLAMVDGQIYAVGGWEGCQRLKTVEQYNPASNTWKLVAPLKLAVTSPAVVAHAGHLYVTGGAILEDGDGIELVQRYDPLTDKWVELAPMLIPRSGSAACVLGGFIYILGGWHASTENTNKVERYNIAEDKWEFCEPMVERRYRPGVSVIENRIYVMGGEEGWDNYHESIESYDPDSDSWEIVADMQSARSWLSCAAVFIRKDLFNQEKS